MGEKGDGKGNGGDGGDGGDGSKNADHEADLAAGKGGPGQKYKEADLAV